MASYMLSVCLVTTLLVPGGPSSGQTPQQPTPAPPQEPTVMRQEPAPPAGIVDEVFVAQTTRNGRAEIEVSKLALTKSIRPDVKMVAQRIVDDHTKMTTELAVIASAKRMILPDDPVQREKASLDRMEKLTGEPFDRIYIAQVITDHVRSIDAFKEYNEKGTDAVLKSWANKMVATLQRHLDDAREVDRKLS